MFMGQDCGTDGFEFRLEPHRFEVIGAYGLKNGLLER
jgi:hypothetical protein